MSRRQGAGTGPQAPGARPRDPGLRPRPSKPESVERASFASHSEDDTRELARRLAADLPAGTTLLLSGDLGVGKTAFVKGLAEGLGLDPDEVTSPTFTLVHEYRGGRLPLVHVDLYRLDSARLDEIGLDSDLAEQGVLAIEWAERLTDPPDGATVIQMRDTGGDARAITIAHSDR